MPSTVRTVSASSTIDPGSPERSDTTWTSAAAGPSAGTTSSTTPDRARCEALSTRRAGVGQRAGEALDGAVGQTRSDGACLGVAVQHGVDDVVDRAGADGVVGGVAYHLEPGQLQQPVRVVGRRLEQRGQWLGPPLEFPLGECAAALDVDPVRGDAHEHVGPGARAELALHPGQVLGGASAR